MLERLPEASLATLFALAQEDGVAPEQLITALVNNEDALRRERAAGRGRNRQRERIPCNRPACFEREHVHTEE